MSNGSFVEFLDELRVFESGVDFERYQQGTITEAQIRGWVGDDNWETYQRGEKTWTELQYTSENALGFVGYQFGEALLIDLGYYEDDFYYGNGAATNTWDGTFTGKGGINSLEDLKTDLQEPLIREAFTYNLNIIENGLNAQGTSLDDLVGEVFTYTDVDGSTVEVELSLTGIMAASHLRGAFGTLSLLTGGGASTDEYGTSILTYIDQFGGYDAPSLEDVLAGSYPDTPVGEGPTDPGPTDPDPVDPDPVDPDPVDPDPVDPAPVEGGEIYGLTWNWGTETTIAFDPNEDKLDFGWLGGSNIALSEVEEGILIEIVGNQQSYLLEGIEIEDLTPENILANDVTAQAEIDDFLL